MITSKPASPYYDQTEEFGGLVSQLSACNISFLIDLCEILLQGSWLTDKFPIKVCHGMPKSHR